MQRVVVCPGPVKADVHHARIKRGQGGQSRLFPWIASPSRRPLESASPGALTRPFVLLAKPDSKLTEEVRLLKSAYSPCMVKLPLITETTHGPGSHRPKLAGMSGKYSSRGSIDKYWRAK